MRDQCICFIYGAFTGLMASRAKTGSQYSNVFEVSTAVIFSFVSRALSTTRYFCYQSLTSGGLVCLLPSIIVRKPLFHIRLATWCTLLEAASLGCSGARLEELPQWFRQARLCRHLLPLPGGNR